MAEPQAEQRSTRRFPLQLPLAVKAGTTETEEDVSARTRDVSARGVYFFVDSKMEPGSPVEFTLTLPPEITLTESIKVRCKGHIVRVDEASGRVGIAAAIDEYEFAS
jgi:hypothetical protein